MELKNLMKSKNEQLQAELFRLLMLYAGQKLFLTRSNRPPSICRLATGGILLYMAATGKVPFLSSIRRLNSNHGQVNFKNQILIQCSREQIFNVFRNFRNFKEILPWLRAAKVLDIEKKHWELQMEFMGKVFTTEVFVVKEKENEFLGWSATPDACIYHTGRIELHEGVVPQVTVMDFVFSYKPPGGKLGNILFRGFRHTIKRHIDTFLRNFSALVDAETVDTK